MQTRFVLISHGRAGTNALGRALGENRDVDLSGEMFHPDHAERQPVRGAPNDGTIPGDELVEQHLFGRAAHPVCGFKLFYFHARDTPGEFRVWPWLLANPDVRVLLVVRRNLLKAFASEQRARQTGSWFPQPGRPVPPPKPIVLETAQALRYVFTMDAYRNWAHRVFADRPLLEVTYEDMAENFEREVGRTATFLGLTPHKPRTVFTAREAPISPASVANYKALSDVFSRTIYSDFLSP